MKRNLAVLATMTAALLLASCGGGGESGGTVAPSATSSGKRALAIATTEASGKNCSAGGVRVDSGLDANNNGVLDASEVQSSQYVCNGSTGATGAASAFLVADELPGTNCTAGGRKFSVGADVNANGHLDLNEVGASTYLCNGVNGTAGLNSIVSTRTELAGNQCPYGGQRFASGLDKDGNGLLSEVEEIASYVLCANPPGAVKWVSVTSDSVQAQPGYGYIADSASRVELKLPANPPLGDVIRITGAGSGGWRIAENVGQYVVASSVHEFTQIVEPVASLVSDVRFSSDGLAGVAAIGGKLRITQDGGNTWSLPRVGGTAMDLDVSQVALADGGRKMAALGPGMAGQAIYVFRSFDGGVNWSSQYFTAASSGWGSIEIDVLGNVWGTVSTGLCRMLAEGWKCDPVTFKGDPLADLDNVTASPDGTLVLAYKNCYSAVTCRLAVIRNGDVVEVRDVTGQRFVSLAVNDVGGLAAIDRLNKVWLSSDLGISARNVTSVGGLSQGTAALSPKGDLLAAADEGALKVSANGGSQWRWLQNFSNPTPLPARAVIPVADGNVVYVRFGNGELKRYRDAWHTSPGGTHLWGDRASSVELQHVGGGVFVIINSYGAISFR